LGSILLAVAIAAPINEAELLENPELKAAVKETTNNAVYLFENIAGLSVMAKEFAEDGHFTSDELQTLKRIMSCP
ncbi:hypothetical protein PENTCL1PPCAC_5565, partial [Pristionchus entomophagus]